MRGYSFDKDEMLKIISGKYFVNRCHQCEGKGWFWVREDGYVITPKPEDDIDCFYQHYCDECDQLGFHIVFKEETHE